jgi:hypothetical protein
VIGYASNTGTRRNLEALRQHGWRVLVTPENPKPPSGLKFGLDNGAWGCAQRKESFRAKEFTALFDRHGGQADFVVVPDIVAGGMDSFRFSVSWLNRLHVARLSLFAVQDGMPFGEVGALLRTVQGLGIFLGGTTEWKLRTMYQWGAVAAALGRYYHVGRVNTARRIRLCAESGANSFDGTSATRFSCTLPLLDAARKQPSLLRPGVCA